MRGSRGAVHQGHLARRIGAEGPVNIRVDRRHQSFTDYVAFTTFPSCASSAHTKVCRAGKTHGTRSASSSNSRETFPPVRPVTPASQRVSVFSNLPLIVSRHGEIEALPPGNVKPVRQPRFRLSLFSEHEVKDLRCPCRRPARWTVTNWGQIEVSFHSTLP
jgi:hypothetical protein